MYKSEDLIKYEFFKDTNLDFVLDALTGVIARGYILGFAEYLVNNNIPFMMAILDIDNFKLVNDNYGHKFGDECLKSIASNMAEYVGQNGLVGRYGGDEFVIIYFGDLGYDNVHDYIGNMYNCGAVVRRRLHFGNVSFYVTATTGCATFPNDAKTYDDLFLTVDKALYRGKSKGRNCFIVYVEAKHKDIDVHKKESSLLSVMFKNIYSMFDNGIVPEPETVIKNVLIYIANVLQVTKAVFVRQDGFVVSSIDGGEEQINDECIKLLTSLVKDDEVYAPSNTREIRKNKKVANFIDNNNLLTFIISRVKSSSQFYGFVLLFEGKIERVWQERDIALLMYLDRLIYFLYDSKKN